MVVVAVEKASKSTGRTVREAARMLGRGKLVTIRSSLAREAVLLATDIADQWHCDLVFDSNWDPFKSPSSLPTYSPVLSHELYDLARAREAKIENYREKDYYEHESNVEIRIRTAALTRFVGFQVVLTTPAVLKTCLLLAGGGNTEGYSMVHMEVDNTTGCFNVLRAFRGEKDVQEYFLELPLQKSVSAACELPLISFQQSEIQEKSPEMRSKPEKFVKTPLKIEENSKLPSKIAGKVTEIMEEFGKNLMRTLPGVSSNYENQEKDQQIAEKLLISVTAFEQNLTDLHSQMQSATDKIDASKDRLGNELKTVSLELKETQKTQINVKNTLELLTVTFQETVSKLTTQITSAETLFASNRQDLSAIKSSFPVKKPLYTVENARQLPSCDLTVIVSYRKPYPLPAYLVISHNDQEKYRIPLDLSQGAEVSLGSIRQYDPADYTVFIVSATGEIVSNRFPLPIGDTSSLPKPKTAVMQGYAGSMIYGLGTIEDVEIDIVDAAGQDGLNVFRSLAERWDNAEMIRMGEFIAVCKETLADGEEATVAKLRAKGFTFR